MWRYFVKRILLAVLTVFTVCVITFFSMYAIPGGPFDKEKAPTPEVQAVLDKRFNLDKSVPEQFVLYLKNFAHGDMGISLKTGRDIALTISETFGVSAKLGGSSVIVALLPGIVLGIMAALYRNKLGDRLIIFFTTLLVSVPSFVLATILLLVFALKLAWFPVWNQSNPNFVLPIISLAMYPMAYITRLTKSSMLDVLSEDYVRTARAKGVPQTLVLYKHALRNAVLPVITYMGPLLAYTLTGSMVVETVFGIGGMGREFVNGIQNRDYTMIMGCTVFLASLVVFMNLLSDLAYKVVDPRISFD